MPSIRPMSETARDPTNSWVPTCERLRRHTSTTNTIKLPTVATTKMIHWTVTRANVRLSTSDDSHEVDDLPVVPVEFQPFVSFELFSFANDGQLVKFILACARRRLFRVSSEWAFIVAVHDAYSGICSYLFLLVASCCHCVMRAVAERTNGELVPNASRRFSVVQFRFLYSVIGLVE